MNINNRQQLLGILAIVVVTIWAGDKLVFSPLTKVWKERSRRITELRQSVLQGSAVVGREQSIRDRWDKMETNTLPTETSVAENQVLKAFERWSQESRISITSIKPQWKLNADDYMTLECRADARYPGGDHEIIVGRVRRVFNIARRPLLFHGGQFHGPHL